MSSSPYRNELEESVAAIKTLKKLIKKLLNKICQENSQQKYTKTINWYFRTLFQLLNNLCIPVDLIRDI